MTVQLIGFRDNKNGGTILTPWSLVHFLSGAAAKQTGLFPRAYMWFIAHGLYEVKDQILDSTTEHVRSVINSVGDQASAMLGYFAVKSKVSMTYFYVWIGSIAVALMLEIEPR